MSRCDELARVSATAGAIERVYLSPEHARVNRLAAEWMRELGMKTRQDAAGNQLGRLEVRGAPDAPALVIGSHLDTVPDAGRYDGVAGVLMALEVVRLLRRPSDDDAWCSPFPFAIEVIAFSDE
jgi:allantoate deiminase